MITVLIIVATFLGVATLVGGVAVMFRRDGSAEAEGRLTAHAQGRPTGGGQSEAPQEAELLARSLDGMQNGLEDFISRVANLRRLMDQADVNLKMTQFLMICIGLAAGGAVAAMATGYPIAALAASPLAAFLPIGWLLFKRKRRFAAFARQLPEAMELVARALRAGHSFAAGFGLVANEMAEPICKEFRRCYESQNLGIALEDALEEMTERVPNLDLRFFATAVILQRQTGGDLAEILDKIGRLIRDRFRIWGQIQALTGEGRLSGIVLLALPPVLFIAMFRLNPTYCMILFEDPMGHQMLAVGGVLQIVGALVIRKIINIKV